MGRVEAQDGRALAFSRGEVLAVERLSRCLAVGICLAAKLLLAVLRCRCSWVPVTPGAQQESRMERLGKTRASWGMAASFRGRGVGLDGLLLLFLAEKLEQGGFLLTQMEKLITTVLLNGQISLDMSSSQVVQH